MKVILFGATGMVGQGVLRECLNDDGVQRATGCAEAGAGEQRSARPRGAIIENDELIEEISANLFRSEESLWSMNRRHNTEWTSTGMRENLSYEQSGKA
jgi:hypothetical protein